jgi:hypothetical protein
MQTSNTSRTPCRSTSGAFSRNPACLAAYSRAYREHKLLGRPLTMDEALKVTNIARRIASNVLFEPSLDANYQEIYD